MKRSAFLAIILAMMLTVWSGCGDNDDGDSSDDDATPADDDDDDSSDDDAGDDDNGDDDIDDDTPPDDDTVDPGEAIFEQDGDDLVLRNDAVELRYHLGAGRYSISEPEKQTFIDHAEAVVYDNVLIPFKKWRTSELASLDWSTDEETNVLGQGLSLTVVRGGEDTPTVAQTFIVLDGHSCVLSQVEVRNATGKSVNVGSIYPLFAEPDGGRLSFGATKQLRTLTNGYLNYVEFATPIFPGTMPTISNWSALLYNQRSKRSLLVGYLTYDMAQPIVYNGPVFGQARAQTLQTTCEYDPAKKVRDGETLAAEVLILDFGQSSPHEALELYGDRLKAWMGIETWLERHPEIGTPAGWNSWSGSGSSGGYGTDIDEQIIVDNMDFADRELRKWGMNYFQIDDGWQEMVGDWIVREDRFPNHGEQNGLAWLMSRAKERGFQTGLWMAAFNAAHSSQVLQDHPEWFADEWLPGILGQAERTLDLSQPAARQHLTDLMEMILAWGVQWVKLDFAYYVLLSANWYEDNITRIELYKMGVQLMRDVLGDDVFFLNVAIKAPNYGITDGLRLTLDTMPVWEGEAQHPYAPFSFLDNQGLKPMYRDSARCWWLNGRIFVNHPDLIFFRAHADPQHPPLTLAESTTFATSVALQGGLVKSGDRLVDLTPEAVDVLRKILPANARTGRPLDLFRREFPEVWSLAVDDFPEPYHLIGLLNWGVNRDLTRLGAPFIADEDRIIGVDLSEAGLDADTTYLAFEFWTQEFLGEVASETLSVEAPAHSPRVVALHPALARPQFIGTNRHVIGGADVITSLRWDDDERTLTGEQEGAVGTEFAPFTHRLTFFVPDGFTAAGAEVTAPSGYVIANQSLTTDGPLAILQFEVEQTTAHVLGEKHPSVTWTLSFTTD
ncbi:MAG TPA: alpha-galactosidase [bacterium]|nr:alpha-galactosidase [bacterium]